MAKTITIADLAKLKKFLGMLGSEHDGEVLNAARMAVKLLKDNDLTWEQIFARTVEVRTPGFDTGAHHYPKGSMGGVHGDDVVEQETMSTPRPMNSRIRMAFDELRGKPLGSFTNFLKSIESFFETRGYLTQAQRQALFDAVERERAK